MREEFETRSLVNQEEIAQHLRQLGFERLMPGAQERPEEIAALSNADSVLGTFGSGLMNVLFMPKAKNLVEIFGPNQRDRPAYFYLASELGIHHCSVEAENVFGRKGPGKDALRVDVTSLTKALLRCGTQE